jgi:hypothetical protein
MGGLNPRTDSSALARSAAGLYSVIWSFFATFTAGFNLEIVRPSIKLPKIEIYHYWHNPWPFCDPVENCLYENQRSARLDANPQ